MAKRSDKTRIAYAKRDRRSRLEAERVVGLTPISDDVYADWLIEAKREGLAAASWRQYRAAAVFVLAEKAKRYPEKSTAIMASIARLNEAKPSPPPKDVPKRTSAQKAKRLDQQDIDRILAAALEKGATGQELIDYWHAACLTGLRPVEWTTAILAPSPDGSLAWVLTVACAKHDDQRGHSSRRTLRFDTFPPDLLTFLRRWIDRASVAANEEKGYDQLRNRVSRLLYDITRELFPGRKRQATLYTARHIAVGRWKAHYIDRETDPDRRLEGAAIIAALLGHSSDLTATRHYARAEKDGSDRWPIPTADPAEVARVKPRLAKQIEKFARLTESKPRAPGPEL